jgi:NADH-quinone oxidoreductase subunit M
MNMLALSIFCPIVLGFILVCMKTYSANTVRYFALMSALLSYIPAQWLLCQFDSTSVDLQYVINIPWLSRFYLDFSIGVDGASVLLVWLTSLVTVLVVLASWTYISEKRALFYGSFLILSGLTIGSFASTNALLFYVFFEATLIPMFIIIGVWGGENRFYAAYKLFLYTLLGSLFFLASIVYLIAHSGSANIFSWYDLNLPFDIQKILFVAMFFAMAIKIPMWPLHTWLPDAHVQAPTGGSIVLAAIMLKLGAYGMLRFIIPVVPQAAVYFAPVVYTMSLMAIVYISLIAIVQQDMKKMIAYSSIAHMGFVTIGLFNFNVLGFNGALVQMISHGFISSAMFLLIGVLYERHHSRDINAYGGLATSMPKLAFFALVFSMANCGLPSTSGFVGEFLVILSTMKVNFWVAFGAALSLILSAGYSLLLFKKVFWGVAANDLVAKMPDLNFREFFIFSILCFATFYFGIYPQAITEITTPFAQKMTNHLHHKALK